LRFALRAYINKLTAIEGEIAAKQIAVINFMRAL